MKCDIVVSRVGHDHRDGLVADVADENFLTFGGLESETAVKVGGRSGGCAFHDDACTDNRLAFLIDYLAGNRPVGRNYWSLHRISTERGSSHYCCQSYAESHFCEVLA